MLTRCRFVLEVCWRCAGVAPLQHAPMSDPSSTTPTPLRHAPPGTLMMRGGNIVPAVFVQVAFVQAAQKLALRVNSLHGLLHRRGERAAEAPPRP